MALGNPKRHSNSHCPWPKNSLTYDGCCSHSSIKEPLVGQNEDATSGEIIRLAAEKKRVAIKKKATRRRNYNAEQGGVAHKGYHKAYEKASGDKALQEQKHQCTPCGLSFRSNAVLQVVRMPAAVYKAKWDAQNWKLAVSRQHEKANTRIERFRKRFSLILRAKSYGSLGGSAFLPRQAWCTSLLRRMKQ